MPKTNSRLWGPYNVKLKAALCISWVVKSRHDRTARNECGGVKLEGEERGQGLKRISGRSPCIYMTVTHSVGGSEKERELPHVQCRNSGTNSSPQSFHCVSHSSRFSTFRAENFIARLVIEYIAVSDEYDG